MIIDDKLWMVINDSMVFKYLLFWSAVFIGVPLGVFLCRLYRPLMHVLFVLMLIGTCEPERLGVSFYTFEHYRTAIRGFEIFAVDLCALTIGITLLWQARHQRLRLFLPLTVPYLVYLLFALLSWSFAVDRLIVPPVRVLETITVVPPPYQYFETGIYPLFEIFRLFRGFLVFWVVANFIRDEKGLRTFYWGVAITTLYIGLTALVDRYFYGIYRVQGNLRHPNDFAVYACMMGSVILPLIFYFKNNFTSFFFGFLALLVIACEILTVSRSGLFAFCVAALIATVYGLRHHLSNRNIIFLFLGLIGCALVFIRAKDTLIDRFIVGASVERSMNERVMFNEEGSRMAQDHFFGVGLGNFSAWSWEKYAQDIHGDLEPGVPAHNIWYLTLGEMGVLGLFALALIWIRTVQVMWKTNTGHKRTLEYCLLFGIALAFFTLHGQCLVHYSYRSNSIYYLIQIFAGVVVGIYYMAKEKNKKEKLVQAA